MLHEFLTDNRADWTERCRIKVAQRSAPRVTQAELTHGIPLFRDQFIRTLQVEQTSEPMKSRRVSGPAGGGGPVSSELGTAAALHGRELLQQGFTVDQVVHDYGDLCQAVTEYAYQRNSDMTNTGVQALNERLGFLAHELRNLLHTAILAFTAIKAGGVGAAGSTGAVLERSLIGLRTLVDRSLARGTRPGMQVHCLPCRR